MGGGGGGRRLGDLRDGGAARPGRRLRGGRRRARRRVRDAPAGRAGRRRLCACFGVAATVVAGPLLYAANGATCPALRVADCAPRRRAGGSAALRGAGGPDPALSGSLSPPRAGSAGPEVRRSGPWPGTMGHGRARRGASGALYPQSAIAGSNSPPRGRVAGSAPTSPALMVGSCAARAREPRQVRKEAALSGPPGVPQSTWPEPGDRVSAGAVPTTWGARLPPLRQVAWGPPLLEGLGAPTPARRSQARRTPPRQCALRRPRRGAAPESPWLHPRLCRWSPITARPARRARSLASMPARATSSVTVAPAE